MLSDSQSSHFIFVVKTVYSNPYLFPSIGHIETLGVCWRNWPIIIFIFQYMTYEDCMKEAYELAEKCRANSSQSQLTIDNKNICDEYEKKLKSLCSAQCAKG